MKTPAVIKVNMKTPKTIIHPCQGLHSELWSISAYRTIHVNCREVRLKCHRLHNKLTGCKKWKGWPGSFTPVISVKCHVLVRRFQFLFFTKLKVDIKHARQMGN